VARVAALEERLKGVAPESGETGTGGTT